MKFVAKSPRARAVAVALAVVLAYSLPSAQAPAKKPLTVEDYTKWKTIAGQDISDNGKWVTYTVQHTNTPQAEAKPFLYLRNLDTNAEVTVQHATGGTFSADSKWIAYQVDPGAAERARRERAAAPGAGGQGGGLGAGHHAVHTCESPGDTARYAPHDAPDRTPGTAAVYSDDARGSGCPAGGRPACGRRA